MQVIRINYHYELVTLKSQRLGLLKGHAPSTTLEPRKNNQLGWHYGWCLLCLDD